MKRILFVYTSHIALIVVLSMVCIWSCSQKILKSYPGPELPKSEIAVLKVSEGLTIHSVDDREIGYARSSYNLGLLPGRHTLSVSLSGVFTRAIGQFNAEAGHSYTFVCRSDYIVSLNRHVPKYCGVQDDASPGSMIMIWQRGR